MPTGRTSMQKHLWRLVCIDQFTTMSVMSDPFNAGKIQLRTLVSTPSDNSIYVFLGVITVDAAEKYATGITQILDEGKGVVRITTVEPVSRILIELDGETWSLTGKFADAEPEYIDMHRWSLVELRDVFTKLVKELKNEP